MDKTKLNQIEQSVLLDKEARSLANMGGNWFMVSGWINVGVGMRETFLAKLEANSDPSAIFSALLVTLEVVLRRRFGVAKK